MITSSLLKYGYFPKELPNTFVTEDFGLNWSAVLDDWFKAKIIKKDVKSLGKTPGSKKKRAGSYTYFLEAAEAEVITKPKRGFERRNISITHPIPQALLCYEIGENWRAISKWMCRQTFSDDEIRISDRYPRGIKGINFPAHRTKKSYIEATSNWLLKTDITRFYPSIYTHSIPWAAYGKESVKNNLGLYKGSLADRLDTLARSCNRNQTIGIPVGPETSRILAEIISSRIDFDFTQHAKEEIFPRTDRLQDDWLIGLATLEDAEQVMSQIGKIYRNYGLEINGSKTSIERLVATDHQDWQSELSGFLSHRSGRLSGKRLNEFLKLSLRLQAQNQASSVLSYSLAVLESISGYVTEIGEIESFLLKATVISPISLDRICRIILNLQENTRDISIERVSGRFEELAIEHLEKGNSYELIWLLHTIRGLKTKIKSKFLHDGSSDLNSSAICLLLLDMDSKGLCARKLPKSDWNTQITEESIHNSGLWLLGYEGFRNGWLPDSNDLMQKPFFKAMNDRGIIFYDPRKSTVKSAKILRERNIARRSQQLKVAEIVKLFRGKTSFLNAGNSYYD